MWMLMAPLLRGQGLLREGKFGGAVASIREVWAVWEAMGGYSNRPNMGVWLVEAMARIGDLDEALRLLDVVVEQVERPGWEERCFYAELLRLKGWVLSLKGDAVDAEQTFQTSLDWARRQQAKMWELRTATSLARLWQTQGKRQQAQDLLAPVYDWFTEGFDTKDLLDAKSLLAELG